MSLPGKGPDLLICAASTLHGVHQKHSVCSILPSWRKGKRMIGSRFPRDQSGNCEKDWLGNVWESYHSVLDVRFWKSELKTMAKEKKNRKRLLKRSERGLSSWISDLVVPNIILFYFPKPWASFKRGYWPWERAWDRDGAMVIGSWQPPWIKLELALRNLHSASYILGSFHMTIDSYYVMYR